MLYLQNSDRDSPIDIDDSDINPSPQRVRNILTLKERVAVIEAYDRRPMYTKVARMFNCSWEQIKNIVSNRDAIMEFYNATLNEKSEALEAKDNTQMTLKQKKINFLGECVYECIKRLQYHAKQPITEEVIRIKALEFQDILKLDDFSPNKKWMNLFKAIYNISLSNKQISIHNPPPSSFDLKDIITYCMKQKSTKPNSILQSRYNKFDTKSMEYESKRLRKLNFLQEALSEYMLRVRVHHKSIKLTTMMMRKIAIEFNEILKVQDFEPTLDWVESFMKRFDSQLDLTNIKKPPLSLDLKDILSYCSRMHNKAKTTTITLAPKETALQMRVLPKFPGITNSDSGLKFQQNPIIYLDEETTEKDIKPDIEEIEVKETQLEQPPPLKIRKIESINNDPELQRNFASPAEAEVSTTKVPKKPQKILQQTYVIRPMPTADKTTKNINPTIVISDVQIKEEAAEETNFILPTSSPSHTSSLPATTFKEESITIDDSESDIELPRHVSSLKDVLLLLKPLEEYAMLKENYRAIGLITQLEEVFKNQTEENTVEEEFIG